MSRGSEMQKRNVDQKNLEPHGIMHYFSLNEKSGKQVKDEISGVHGTLSGQLKSINEGDELGLSFDGKTSFNF